MTNTRQDTRRNTRHRLRFQVTLGRTSCFTVNVSSGGFCTEVMHVLPSGSPVTGAVRVRGKDYPFTGRVAWARLGNAQMNLRGKMGIVFEAAPQELLRAVAGTQAETPAPDLSPSGADRRTIMPATRR